MRARKRRVPVAEARAPQPAPTRSGTRTNSLLEHVRRYKLLLVICLIAVVSGARESTLRQHREPLTWFSPDGRILMDVISRLNPDEPDTQYLLAMHALADGDEAEFLRRLDRTLGSGAKHSEEIFKLHAEYLLLVGAEPQELNVALNRWHRNFPFSDKSFLLNLPAAPASAQERLAFERQLAELPWVMESHLEQVVVDDGGDIDNDIGGGRQWAVAVTPRRGRKIDVRDVDAVALRVFGTR